jgi:hypothetical protein
MMNHPNATRTTTTMSANSLTRPGEYRVPDPAQLVQCHSCHAPIYWVRTSKNGKPIPLSAATVRTDAFGVRWAITHFADCPSASQHHKPGLAAGAAPTGATLGAMDLRYLPDYLARHRLVVTGSTVTDAGNGRLHIELQTRKA